MAQLTALLGIAADLQRTPGGGGEDEGESSRFWALQLHELQQCARGVRIRRIFCTVFGRNH